jgi:hypothetical protein
VPDFRLCCTDDGIKRKNDWGGFWHPENRPNHFFC